MRKKAIILVAGMGTRLQPLTLKNHKCLTEINGVPILGNCLENISKVGIDEAVLVIGYLGDKIKSYIGGRYGQVDIIYAENADYACTNTSQSLYAGLKCTDGYDELYVFEGDVFYEYAVLKELCSLERKNVTVLEAYNSELDGTFVTIDERQNVIDWRHKSMRGEGYRLEDKYKTVNIHKFSPEFIYNILMPQLEKSIKENKGKDPLENVMQEIVGLHPDLIYGYILNGKKWFEIDDKQDLLRAERMFLSR